MTKELPQSNNLFKDSSASKIKSTIGDETTVNEMATILSPKSCPNPSVLPKLLVLLETSNEREVRACYILYSM